MDVKELLLFQSKFKLSDDFMEIVYSLFERLIHFGYISNKESNKLIHNLSENIKEIYIGTKNQYDYKTGFYDASKKILYIKSETDVASIYLRFLYAIATKEPSPKKFITGYSVTKMRTDSYKLEHINFGINRAVMANLACKLCDALPIDMDIVPSYKTYTHNFLGEEISSNNDIYALESKILEELCFGVGIDESVFYEGVFKKDPIKYLSLVFKKKNFKDTDTFFKILDDISLKYNKYNKLVYLSKELNRNYIEIKKNILNDDVKSLNREKKDIESQILAITNKEKKDDLFSEDETYEFRNNLGLSETIEDLEDELKKKIIEIQDILSNNIVHALSSLSIYKYASKLIQFNNMLITPSSIVNKKIMELVLYELIPTNEIKAVNIIQKIRYAIILGLLSTDQFAGIANNFSFCNVEDLTDEDLGTTCVILTANKMFAKVVEISGLNTRFEKGEIKAKYLTLDNLKYIINSDFSNTYIDDIEKLYTKLTTDFELFKNVSLENIYVFQYLGKDYLIIYKNYSAYVVNIEYSNRQYNIKLLNTSDSFKVFEPKKVEQKKILSNLPVISKKNLPF